MLQISMEFRLWFDLVSQYWLCLLQLPSSVLPVSPNPAVVPPSATALTDSLSNNQIHSHSSLTKFFYLVDVCDFGLKFCVLANLNWKFKRKILLKLGWTFLPTERNELKQIDTQMIFWLKIHTHTHTAFGSDFSSEIYNNGNSNVFSFRSCGGGSSGCFVNIFGGSIISSKNSLWPCAHIQIRWSKHRTNYGRRIHMRTMWQFVCTATQFESS